MLCVYRSSLQLLFYHTTTHFFIEPRGPSGYNFIFQQVFGTFYGFEINKNYTANYSLVRAARSLFILLGLKLMIPSPSI